MATSVTPMPASFNRLVSELYGGDEPPPAASPVPPPVSEPLDRDVLAGVVARAKAAMAPSLHGRIDKAMQLVLSGFVTLHDDGTATVGSQTSASTQYHVNGQCDCRDASQAEGGWCKHRLARALLLRTREAQTLITAQLDEGALAANGRPAVPGIPPQFIIELRGKWFITYPGLLSMAHERGLVRLTAEVTTYLDGVIAIATATASFADGRVFSESGDASPANVSATVRPHYVRMALTRAKSRCLRDALNIGLVAYEELGE